MYYVDTNFSANPMISVISEKKHFQGKENQKPIKYSQWINRCEATYNLWIIRSCECSKECLMTQISN